MKGVIKIRRLRITTGLLFLIAGTLSGQGIGPWFPMAGPWCAQKIIDMACTNANPPTIYVVNEGNSQVGGAIAKSTDEGINWQLLSPYPDFEHVKCVAVDPDNPDVAFKAVAGTIGQDGGVFYSTNGGNTWIDISGTGLPTSILPTEIAVFTWDGKDNNGSILPEGIYFLKICSGSKIITQKVIKMTERR